MRFTVFDKFDSTGKVIVNQDEIVISLKSRPEDGKANIELIKKLADYFGLSTERVRIISGKPSRKKLVEVWKQIDC